MKTTDIEYLRIPLAVPTWGKEEIEAAKNVLHSGWLTMGQRVQEFEQVWADYVGVRHAVMVNSGSSANLIALSALVAHKVLTPRQYVSTPAVTWATTVAPIVQLGLLPMFYDVELPDYIWHPKSPYKSVGVHLLGNPIHSSPDTVLGDCCESHGALYKGKNVGALSLVTTFSFFMSHHITTVEGGMVCTNDDALADTLRSIRAHGWIRERTDKEVIAEYYQDIDPRFLFYTLGYNVRPTEIAAVFGLCQLPKLESFIAHRRELAQYWVDRLKPFEEHLILPREQVNTRHAWFAFPLTIRPGSSWKRNELVKFLESKGIETRPIMSGNITRHPMLKGVSYGVDGLLKTADWIHDNGFLVGCHTGIGLTERIYLLNCIEEFAKEETI